MNRRKFLVNIALAGGAVAAAPVLELLPAAEPTYVGPGVVPHGAYALIPTEFESQTVTLEELNKVGQALDELHEQDAILREMLDKLEEALAKTLEGYIDEPLTEELSRRLEKDIQALVPTCKVESVVPDGPDRVKVNLGWYLPSLVTDIAVRLEP